MIYIFSKIIFLPFVLLEIIYNSWTILLVFFIGFAGYYLLNETSANGNFINNIYDTGNISGVNIRCNPKILSSKDFINCIKYSSNSSATTSTIINAPKSFKEVEEKFRFEYKNHPLDYSRFLDEDKDEN
ncbi:MAG: hypothetical protein SFT93_01165 [Rickettsiaceae bacterium]|nr:hypothetical protein [Rickettsiaceae bacterium]